MARDMSRRSVLRAAGSAVSLPALSQGGTEADTVDDKQFSLDALDVVFHRFDDEHPVASSYGATVTYGDNSTASHLELDSVNVYGVDETDGALVTESESARHPETSVDADTYQLMLDDTLVEESEFLVFEAAAENGGTGYAVLADEAFLRVDEDAAYHADDDEKLHADSYEAAVQKYLAQS